MNLAKIKLAGLVVGVLYLSGCTKAPQALYNYGDYSKNYYAYKKNMSNESLLALQKSIEVAIEKSADSSSGRVPPGMYANLGYIYLKNGKTKKAIVNFTKEKSIYPESAHFINGVIKKAELAEGEKND